MHFDPDLAKKIGSLEDLQEIASLIREWKVFDDLGRIATQDHWFFWQGQTEQPHARQRSQFCFSRPPSAF